MKPATALTSLHLESNIDIGPGPFVDFNQLTFPHLESLSLMNVLFDGDGSQIIGTENFIRRHGATLRKLELYECAIDIEENDAPGRFWSDIWDQFAEQLVVLEDIVVEYQQMSEEESEEDAGRQDPELRYSRLDAGFGYLSIYEDLEGEERDKEALEALKLRAKNRKEGKSEGKGDHEE